MVKLVKNTKRKGVTLYNKILKEFTKVNNKLPQDRKLSLADRRKYISEIIYPQYKGNNVSRIGTRAINTSIYQVLETIIPKEGCDVNYISPSITADIGWFELDDFIRDVLPKCIYIKIDAKEYGSTKIFNTLNYNYTKNGVKSIVENIREVVNNDSSIDMSFTGLKKLKRGKTNDGTPENYYLLFVLIINSEPTSEEEVTPIIFNLPKSEKKKVISVRNAILTRVKQLSNKKKRKKRARKSAIKNINKIKRINSIQRRSTNPTTKKRIAQEKIKEFNRMRKGLDRDFNNGLLHEEQYKKFLQELYERVFDNRKKGGII